MVSASQEVPSGELMTAARHQSAATNAGYQAANEAAHSTGDTKYYFMDSKRKRRVAMKQLG
jgi:hypothetical protein